MDLEIPMEDYSSEIGRGNYDRLEILKAKQFPKLQSTNAMLQGTVDSDTNILMDATLYEAVAKDDVNNFIDTLEKVSMDKELHVDAILDQMTISGNSLLHKAASSGSVDIAELVIDHFAFLLIRRNNLGDTALHVATKAKKLSVIKVLIDKSGKLCPANDNDTLLQMKNHIGNTALHEAVKALFPDAVQCLFLANPKVSCCLNESGESPLRLAIETGKKEIVDLLFRDPGVYDGLVGRPQEESPVYAAILMERLDILEEIFEKNPILFHIRDKKRKTPLYLAASEGCTEVVRFLLSKFGQQALESSTNGDFPIHIACKKGHIKVVEELLKQEWPNPIELLNKEGQNILHVAAMSGKNTVVKTILEYSKPEELLNAGDKNGNTALHLASMNLHALVLCSLTRDKRVDLNRKNKEGLTAIDIALGIWTNSLTRKVTTLWALRSAGAGFSEKGKKTISQRGRELPDTEKIKDTVNFILVIAVLVATVTFTAGLTVPGGFNSSDNGGVTVSGGYNIPGLATLRNKRAFQVFIVCDSVAMYCSMTAAFLLIWSFFDRNLAVSAITWAFYLVELAIFKMFLAFMSAIYSVVSDISWVAYLILVMGILCLSCFVVFLIALFFPFGIRHPIFHRLCQVVIPLMLYFTQPFNDEVDDHEQEPFPVEKDKHEESQLAKEQR